MNGHLSCGRLTFSFRHDDTWRLAVGIGTKLQVIVRLLDNSTRIDII